VADATNGRILIIDDNDAVRIAHQRLLERAGYEVRAAASAFAGLELTTEWPPDLILLDIAMPVVSGLEALKIFKTKSALRDAHIVAFSGFITDDELDRFRRIGFDDVLPKPIDADNLTKRIAAFLRDRRSGNDGSAASAKHKP
jgi:CheY-like chemotaxis protein